MTTWYPWMRKTEVDSVAQSCRRVYVMKRGTDSEKRAFKEALKRCVGRCVLQLMTGEGRRKFRPLVLWACSRDLEYDTQVAGTRTWYLHQMIRQYEDVTPFLRIVEKAMVRTFCTRGWLFAQSAELLTLLAADGHARARSALHNLWAMAARRMLTADLLRECLYDCNEDTRRYAARLLRRRQARRG